MRERFGFRFPALSRRATLPWAGALSVLVAVVAPSGTQTAVANGDTRTIRLYHAHTKETIEATFRVGGQYDPAVLKQLNWFLRDWRRDEPTNMDPRLFDTVWEAYRSAGGGGEYVTVMSAYRSPETNAMLRRRSRAVAEYSQHMLGKAMDTSMPGMSMEQIREVGMRMQRGGVGYYPSAGTPFVHLDVGSVRSWPRMPYEQLARLFPDGKTVHLPSNGQPLARYEEARAEIAALGAIAPPSSRSTGFFAWLFGGSGNGGRDGDDEDAVPVAAPRVQMAGRRGRNAVQVASASPEGAGAPVSTSDDSGRDFFAQQAARTAVRTAATPESIASAPPEAPRSEPVRTAVASLERAQDSETPSTVPALVTFADRPIPPRRPTDLAAVSDAPLPPARPIALASFSLPTRGPVSAIVTAYAGAEPPLRRDPIGTLLDRQHPAGSVEKVIRVAPVRPLVAVAGPMTGLRAARAAPTEASTAVAPARLDRSNFRALTGSDLAAKASTHAHGAVLTASRSVARASATSLAPTTNLAATSFGAQATDLSTSRFMQPKTQQATVSR